MDYSDTYGSLDPADPLSMYGGDFYGYNDGYDPSLMGGGYFDPSNDPNSQGGFFQNNPTAAQRFEGGTVDPPQYDPTGGSGVTGDPYNLGANTPTFSTTGTGQMPTDPTIPNPPDPGNGGAYPPYPFPPPTPKPYPPPGTMTQGNTFPQRTALGQQRKTQPAQRPSLNMAPPSTPSMTSVNMGGMPGISNTVPSSQQFSYQPISIGRQGAPNVGAQGAPQAGGQSAPDQLGGAMGPFSALNPYARLNQDRKQNSLYPYDDTGV